MKTFAISVLFLLLFVLAGWITVQPTASSAADKAPQSTPLERVSLKVEGMTCGGCALAVRKTLEKQKGVLHAKVSLEKGQAEVEAIKGKVRPEDLAAAVTKIGYKATVIRAD